MTRAEFPAKVKVKCLAFAEFRCEGIVTRDDGSKVRCNATLAKGRVEFDHDIAAELGGPATFENCRALCRVCHREKYPSDAKAIAKARRREAADVGATRPKQAIQSPGFKHVERAHAERGPANGMSEIARRYSR